MPLPEKQRVSNSQPRSQSAAQFSTRPLSDSLSLWRLLTVRQVGLFRSALCLVERSPWHAKSEGAAGAKSSSSTQSASIYEPGVLVCCLDLCCCLCDQRGQRLPRAAAAATATATAFDSSPSCLVRADVRCADCRKAAVAFTHAHELFPR